MVKFEGKKTLKKVLTFIFKYDIISKRGLR